MRYKRPIYFCNFIRAEYVEKDGKKTGRRITVYDNVVTVYGTVSTPTGTAVLDMFGTDKDYDKIVVLDKPDIDINENTVLWLDVPYSENVAHDYIVRRVIRNHNFLTIGVRKVDVKKPTLSGTESDGDGEHNQD